MPSTASSAGLTHERLTYHGPHFTYDNVPMELRRCSSPIPPFWYPSSNETGAQWAGEHGLHFATLGSVERAKASIDAYQAGAGQARRRRRMPKPEFPGGAVIGVNRQVVVADTVEDARRIAKPAFDRWYSSLTKLERENVAGPRYVGHVTGDMESGAGKRADDRRHARDGARRDRAARSRPSASTT